MRRISLFIKLVQELVEIDFDDAIEERVRRPIVEAGLKKILQPNVFARKPWSDSVDGGFKEEIEDTGSIWRND